MVLGADPDVPGMRAPAEMARGLAAAHKLPYRKFDDTSHFPQIEAPEDCAAAVRAFSASIGHGTGPLAGRATS